MDLIATLILGLAFIALVWLASWRLARPRSSVKPINVKRTPHNGGV